MVVMDLKGWGTPHVDSTSQISRLAIITMGDSRNLTCDVNIPFPVLIDQRASDTPDRTFAIIPRTANISDGYREYKYSELAQAVNKISWWLDQELGKSVNLETIAYMGSPDLRYSFLVVGALKTRRNVST